MNKVVNWMDFARFIIDKDIWSKWNFQIQGEGEQYFIEAWAAARDNRLMPSFDFSKTAVTVISKDDAQINWEHDGESLWYFFSKWAQGVRL